MIFKKKKLRGALKIMHANIQNTDCIWDLMGYAGILRCKGLLTLKEYELVLDHLITIFGITDGEPWADHLKAGREHWLWYQIRDLTPWYKESEGADRELPTTSLPRVLLFWGIAIPLVILCTYLFVNYNGQ
jgi:hypothetical protein